MPTFTYIPGYPAVLSEVPAILMTAFGDGYQQRLGDGINNIRQIWSLNFPGRTDADALAIVNFFRGQGGWQSFDWTPPRPKTAPAIKVICRLGGWRIDVINRGVCNVQATFEQVFET